jgi:hypothetical protein
MENPVLNAGSEPEGFAETGGTAAGFCAGHGRIRDRAPIDMLSIRDKYYVYD